MFRILTAMMKVVSANIDAMPCFNLYEDGSGCVNIDTPVGPENLFAWERDYQIYLHFGYWLFDGEPPSPKSVEQKEYATLVRGKGVQVIRQDFQEAWITWYMQVFEERKKKNG